jgi:hypothetical protein
VKARWLTFLLVLAIAPGTMEVVETAVHYAKYGDLSDAADDVHGTSPLGVDEHGCSGTFHLCSCHCGQSVRAPDQVATLTPSIPPDVRPDILLGYSSLHGLLSPLPDLRPPIA